MKKKVIAVVGARPNFIKIAPLMKEFKRYKKHFETLLVHTGQHYDFEMSAIFFKDLNVPKPDIHLDVGSWSHATQTAKIMTAFEKVVIQEKPDIVIVVGDVNSTVACSLVASMLQIKVAHVEAGLRSFDRSMPEEINRLVTDSLSDYLFVSEESGLKNLTKEGVPPGKIYFVGNVMIDTLLSNMGKIDKSSILNHLALKPRAYSILTLHRPSNVDSEKSLAEIFGIIEFISQQIKIIYPLHPRTKKMIKRHKFLKQFESLENLLMIDPLGYCDFIKLVKESKFVLTDSGGIQEETTCIKIPCLTIRENTERPVTLKKGTNYLVGRDKQKIARLVRNILKGKTKEGIVPKLWDGKTARRIIELLTTKD